MKAPAPVRPLLCALAALAFLTACGAQNGASTLPQGPVAPEQAKRHPSMSPDVRGTYLYVADSGNAAVYVYKNFPDIKKHNARVIRDLGPVGLCSDKDGNVFVTGVRSGEAAILEYAHGGTTPIATLADSPSTAPAGCAVDQTNENLAVANEASYGWGSSGNVLVFKGAKGTPATYTSSTMTEPVWCAYDNAGNLYVVGVNGASGGVVYAILRKGSTELVNLNISGLQTNLIGGIAWDGKYLAVPGSVTGSDLLQIYQIQISGSSGTIVNKNSLGGFRVGGGMVIYDGQLLLPIDHVRVARWPYPAGGNAKEPQQILGDIVTDEAISAKSK